MTDNREQQSTTKRNLSILAIVLILLLAAAVIFIIIRTTTGSVDHEEWTETLEVTTIAQTEPVTELETEPETEPYDTAVSAIDGSIIRMIDVDPDTWYLTLVSRYYVLKEDFTCETEGLKGGYDLDVRAAEWFNKMYDAAKADGITLNVLSGYRSVSYQGELYEKRIKRCMNEDGLSYDEAKEAAAQWVLPPGTSEHNLGLSVDIGWLTKDFENSAAYAWLDKHAADYGFVLRYPEDKEDITKVHYEPWHWRYIGIEDAKKLKAMGLISLEEYLGISYD